MNSQNDRDHWIKIQQTNPMKRLFINATWMHPYHSWTIGKPRHNLVVSIKRRVIAIIYRDASFHPRVTPLFCSLKESSSRRKNNPWIFRKFDLFTLSFHVPLVSWCSSCISASIECLKSNFDRERRKNSHLELQFSSSKTRNEKPCIRRLIRSFQSLIWVRLRVFILIFHHLM